MDHAAVEDKQIAAVI